MERLNADVSKWSRSDWESLRERTVMELRTMGCQLWDSSKLVLFPAGWFPYIPDGYEVLTINGTAKRFDRATTSDDRRFGALAFGVVGL